MTYKTQPTDIIPCRRNSLHELVPEGWSRTRASYHQAAGEATKHSIKPQSATAKNQLKRFEARRKEDERKMKGIML